MVIPKHIRTFLEELASYIILIAIVLGFNALITNAIIKHQCKNAVERIITIQKDNERTFLIKTINSHSHSKENNERKIVMEDEQ